MPVSQASTTRTSRHPLFKTRKRKKGLNFKHRFLDAQVVVIQEWWGVDEAVKGHAAAIASKGFRTLVPDLYRGKLGVEAEEAQHLMDGLDWPGAVEDIKSAVTYLGENGKPVGMIGFCMGGALTVAGSVHATGLACAVPCYGICPPGLADPADAKCPVQGHFGAEDGMAGFSSPADADKLRVTLKTVSADNEIFLYDGAGHAFLNDRQEDIERKKKLGQGDHNPSAVATAWERIFAFFGQHLK